MKNKLLNFLSVSWDINNITYFIVLIMKSTLSRHVNSSVLNCFYACVLIEIELGSNVYILGIRITKFTTFTIILKKTMHMNLKYLSLMDNNVL